MATLYADRAFISIGGVPVLDVQSAQLRQNHNSRAVNTMTPDNFNRGFVRGNRDIDISLTVAVENELGRPKFDFIDYAANDVALTFIVGADQYSATGLFIKENDDNAGGIGDEVKASFSFGAIKVVDTKGNSSLFDLSL